MRPSVLQLIGSFHTGGSERQAVQLARLLHESGATRVFPACLDRSGALLGEIERLNLGEIPEFRLNSFYDRDFLRQVRRCAGLIRENNIEIVQTHDFYTNVFGMAAARLAGAKATIAAKRETGGMRSGAQKIIEKTAFRLARVVVVNSETVKKYLTQAGVPASKIVTIYNGLDLTRMQPNSSLSRAQILRQFGLPAETKKTIAIVANLRHPVKNQEMFLRAAAHIIKNNRRDAAFVLAGEGERTAELKILARNLEIENETFFLGGRAEIAHLLRVSDVCVLSSTSEGFSNAILEYMAAARPVVATNVGGAAEAIEDGRSGFLVESNDDRAMADKIGFLLDNPEQAGKMGERGREIAEQKFSLAAQLAKTLDVYARLLEK